MSNPMRPLLLVDGNNLLHRAAYVANQDTPYADVKVFLALLNGAATNYLRETPEVIVAFDGKRASDARKEIHAGYKGTRPDKGDHPDKINPYKNLEELISCIETAGITVLHDEFTEADDMIGATIGLNPTRRTLVLSADKDFYQLISDHVLILNTQLPAGQRYIRAETVEQKFGVSPAVWADFRALMGDKSDNIPGVPGIGPRMAANILAGGVTLDNLPAEKPVGVTNPAWKSIQENMELALTYRGMIRLSPTLPEGTPTPTGEPYPGVDAAYAQVRFFQGKE